jgi:hypothetical protein
MSQPISSKDVDAYQNVDASNFKTVHADKAIVAIDFLTNRATLTLLAMHPIPKVTSQSWTLQDIVWDVTGEIYSK